MDSSVLFSLGLSIRVATVATLGVLVVGLPIAYFLAMKRFWGSDIVDMLCTLPLVLPPTVTGYYLIVLVGRNGFFGKHLYQWTGWSIMFTWYAAALASFVVAIPLMIRTSRAAIESVDRNLINASYTLGHSELNTALKVILPLSKKGIIAGTVLSFARAIGEFGATLMLAGNIPGKTDTMPLAIYSLASAGEWSQTHIFVIVLTLMSGFIIYIANRYSRRTI